MRKNVLIAALFTLVAAAPLYADRAQSYFTFEDGGTVVRTQDDGRDIDARVNLPIFPGDEVTTSRRGRAEIRLSDGNVVALDRATDVRFRSILDSYDGDSSQTVIELKYGHVAVHRTEYGQQYVRIDTDGASYIATVEATYAVDSDRGRDRVTVFDGAVEVRTPQRTERVNAGEEARIDEQGLYAEVNGSQGAADDFERWFMRRSELGGSSRYLDRSLAYADSDLSTYGSWVYVNDYNAWAWRPRVDGGWRPYYYGEWVTGPSGCLVWVSDEPWGWVPYHYGRWAYDPGFGWVWLPGTGYSPAWVYWLYGSGYVGWAPAGWWDCYRPYYNWCYRPYARASWDVGWFGRMRGRDLDLRPWTFLQPNRIVGTRVDTGALTTDLIRQRLLRGDGEGAAVIGTGPARFSRNELRDPSLAVDNIVRRGGMTGGGSFGGGLSVGDVTPFIRRDPALNPSIRDRVVRARGGEGGLATAGSVAPIGSGSVAPIGTGSVAPIGRGSVAPIGRGTAPVDGSDGRFWRGNGSGGSSNGTGNGAVDRGSRGQSPTWRGDGSGTVRRDGPATSGGDTSHQGNNPQPAPAWRDRVARPAPPSNEPAPQNTPPRQEWRSRGVAPGSGSGSSGSASGTNDVPRRVIDRIGGPRLVPSGSAPAPRSYTPPPRVERSAPPPPPPSSGSSHHDSGSSHHDSGDRGHRN